LGTSFRKNSDSPQLDSLNKSLYGLQIDLDVLANITADKASLEQEEFGESLFLRKLILGIQAQVRGKSLTGLIIAIAQTPTKQPALRLSRTKNLHFAKATFPGFSAVVGLGLFFLITLMQ
jgi:hypothetical protein